MVKITLLINNIGEIEMKTNKNKTKTEKAPLKDAPIVENETVETVKVTEVVENTPVAQEQTSETPEVADNTSDSDVENTPNKTKAKFMTPTKKKNIHRSTEEKLVRIGMGIKASQLQAMSDEDRIKYAKDRAEEIQKRSAALSEFIIMKAEQLAEYNKRTEEQNKEIAAKVAEAKKAEKEVRLAANKARRERNALKTLEGKEKTLKAHTVPEKVLVDGEMVPLATAEKIWANKKRESLKALAASKKTGKYVRFIELFPEVTSEQVYKAMGDAYSKDLHRSVQRSMFIQCKQTLQRDRNRLIAEYKKEQKEKNAKLFAEKVQDGISKNQTKRLEAEKARLEAAGAKISTEEMVANKAKNQEAWIQRKTLQLNTQTDAQIVQSQLKKLMEKSFIAAEVARNIKKHTAALKYGTKLQRKSAQKYFEENKDVKHLEKYGSSAVEMRPKSRKVVKPTETQKENEYDVSKTMINYKFMVQDKSGKILEEGTLLVSATRTHEIFTENGEAFKKKYGKKFSKFTVTVPCRFLKEIERQWVVYVDGKVEYSTKAKYTVVGKNAETLEEGIVNTVPSSTDDPYYSLYIAAKEKHGDKFAQYEVQFMDVDFVAKERIYPRESESVDGAGVSATPSSTLEYLERELKADITEEVAAA